MKKAFVIFFTTFFAVILVACGSNQPELVDNQLSTGISATTKSLEFGEPASTEAISSMNEKLGGYFNGQHANNPQALMGLQATVVKADGVIQALNAANPKDIFRFYNTKTGAHFFTMSLTERDYVRKTFPFYLYEGSAFLAYSDPDVSLSPVYRFYNNITGAHFFTVNAAEKNHVIATWPTIFNYEGIAWYASTTSEPGLMPVYRFFNTKTGTHFYTVSAQERDHILATWNWYLFEGISYYAVHDTRPPIDPTCGLANFKADIMARLNAFRTMPQVCGGVTMPAVRSLVWDDQLQLAATTHSTDMATLSFFSHTGSDGKTFRQRLPDAGYKFTYGGENIAAGQTSVAQVMGSWIASPSHCANMMQPLYRDMAVSCVANPASAYKTYWTMTLGVR